LDHCALIDSSQVARSNVSFENKACWFYYNPRLLIEKFTKRNWWFRGRDPQIYVLDSEICRVMGMFWSTLEGLQPDQPVIIDVNEQRVWGIPFLGPGFINFIRDLLQCFYPTLRHGHFKTFRDNRNNPVYVWGNSLDKSPLLPKLTVSKAVDYRSATIRFLANGAWVHDRDEDVRGCVGSGFLALAMSQHPRLGRGSPLRALDLGVLRMISTVLSTDS
jgi:hypothetical protein